MLIRRSPLQSILGRCRRGLAATAAFSCLVNLLTLTVSVYMLQVYDRVLSSQSGYTLIYLTIMAVAALAAMAVFDLLRSRILVRIGIWLDQVLSPAVFARAVENSLRGTSYRSEALRDLASVRQFLGGAGVLALFDVPWTPVYIAFVYLLHPMLGNIALAGGALLFLLALLTNLATHGPLREASAAASRGLRAADATFRNAEVVDGMGMLGAILRRWLRNSAGVLDLQQRASDRAGLVSAAAKCLRQILQIGILGMGAWLVLKHEMTAGGIVAGSIIMGRGLAPVEQAIGTWKTVVATRDAWKRLKGLFDQPPFHPAAMQLPKPRGYLRVENVTFAPPGAKHPVLHNVSLNLPAGQALAVIGPSAAGKSTLARLLVGLGEPQSGAVRLDGAAVFAGDRRHQGAHIGYLPQDVELFPGTLRDNIARMDENAEPEEVAAAARLAGVHEMILRLPQGYETEIGEQGGVLSGGQRQRIGLARALYGRPSLLVLDEPNSNLDAAGEHALNEAIRTVKEAGTTVVVIAHRPSLIAHVDRIALLNEGRVDLFGERQEVLAQLQRRAMAASAQSPQQAQVRALRS
jgi:ATP-binding cassette, subfamily C, type I secretion system permease/ATPase